MRMITGFIPPSSARPVIGGHDILTESIPARQKIGYLPENAPVYPDMKRLRLPRLLRGDPGIQPGGPEPEGGRDPLKNAS